MLQIIKTDLAPQAIGPYAQGIINQNILYTSGQIGLDPQTGELVKQSFAAEATQALKNMLAIVQAAGSCPEKVISVDVYLTDMTNFSTLNEIYAQFFARHTPVRAVLGVSSLPRGAALETRCLAAL